MQKIIKALAVITAVCLARALPFNWIIGSDFVMFSFSSIFAPVVALQCGLIWVSCFFFSLKLWTTSSLVYLCLHRLPLILSAQAFVRSNVLISIGAPLLCMILFMVHPVGGQVWIYSLYWIIPMVLYMINQSLWSRALQASFIAHAVGSVVWLYTKSIPAEIWLSLIPIVAIERLIMAGGIVICNELCQIFVQGIVKFFQKQIDYKAI